ncbi:hypothetical protein [Paraburkholderia metrosideri]|uniref:Plasmid related protein n=1 Tax=Paraburkholderia metrosideri TaxID=580937 RepID=A0ABM8P5S8_9BURK|nr:hypothetical protein [Paraburkholderia metrosideri]CAD6557062.1 hypothetical protein LMG28140_06055 [Paraburkholderia metrosideri]
MNLPSIHLARPRMKSGKIFVTPAALTALQTAGVSLFVPLLRHLRCDWGDISESDRRQNELALTAGLRILSNYALPKGGSVWIITEWDRSATTILLPDDY